MEETQVESTANELESGQQLIEAVRKQVEYYFSKENLQSDPYLTSQMDASMSVPISVVMKFAKMKALTQDEEVLRQALENSNVTIVDNKIKANIKSTGRSTIILREIPSDAALDEVREIFNYTGSKPINSIRSDIGDTWFVIMDTEEDAKDTLLDLRMKKRTFRDQAVKARLKTETVVRSFYPLNAAAPIAPAVFPVMPYGGLPMDMRAFGYMGMGMMPTATVPLIPTIPLISSSTSMSPSPTGEGSMASVDCSANESTVDAGTVNAVSSSTATETADNNSNKNQAAVEEKVLAAPATTSNSGTNNANTSNNNTRNKSSGHGRNNGGNNNNGSNNNNNGQQQKSGGNTAASTVRKGTANGNNRSGHNHGAAIEITAANFPPLAGADDTPLPTPGYKGSFVKYSGDEIINIAKGVKEAILPSSLDPAQHPLSMTVEANKDLLKRQRSFSIDETREQLRQGRPVQREAVISGKVDSRSLLYGDDATAPAVAAPSAPAPSAAAVVKAAVVPKAPVTASPVCKSKAAASEAKAAVSEVVEQVTAAASAMALNNAAAASVVEDASVAASASPLKITPSSWAAMVKSATNIGPAVGSLNANAPTFTSTINSATSSNSASSSAARPTTASSKAAKTNAGSAEAKRTSNSAGGNGNANKNKEGKSARKRSESATSNNAGDASNSGKRKGGEGSRQQGSNSGADKNSSKKAASNAAGGEKQPKAQKSIAVESAEGSSDAAVAVAGDSNAATPTWGGKASFANILKQQSDAVTASPVKVAAPAASEATSAPTNNSNNHGKSSGSNSRSQRNSNNNSHNNNNNSNNSHSNNATNQGGRSNSKSTGSGNKNNSSSSSSSSNSSTNVAAAPAAAGEWSTSTGKARNSGGAKNTSATTTSSNNSNNNNGGANASGVWAKETLPALPEK